MIMCYFNYTYALFNILLYNKNDNVVTCTQVCLNVRNLNFALCIRIYVYLGLI